MSSTPGGLDDVFEQLDQEQQQEQSAKLGQDSYLQLADPTRLREREREYRDVEKHWVRYRWLANVKATVEHNQRAATYLTLPALYRLDVSLLHRENLLRVTQEIDSPPIVEVAGFEVDATRHGRMASQTPVLRLFGLETVQRAILNEHSSYHEQLLKMFPFDVVNLDLTTSLTPAHEGPYSDVMQAINEVLKRQSVHRGRWMLFLTFRNVQEEWEQAALNHFLDNLQKNLEEYPSVREIFNEKYHHPSVQNSFQSDPNKTISQSVTKWVLDRAHYYSMQLTHLESYYYTRYEAKPPYIISKLIMGFVRGEESRSAIPAKANVRQTWMNDDLVTCIRKHKYVDVESTLYTLKPEQLDQLQKDIAALCALVDQRAGTSDRLQT